MNTLLTWVMGSTGRLLGALVVAAVLVTLLLSATAGVESREEKTPPPAAALEAGIAGLHTERYANIGIEFVKVWASTELSDTARGEALSRLATPELASALSVYEPVGSSPERVTEIRYAAEDGAVLIIELQDATRVVIAMVNDADGIRVSNIEPAGDVEHIEDV